MATRQYLEKSLHPVYKFSNAENRPNRTAKGMTRTYERGRRWGKEVRKPDVGTLMVRGTCDPLAKRMGVASLSKKVMKEHPTDKGYFKQVYVLSDFGRTRLQNLKRKCDTP